MDKSNPILEEVWRIKEEIAARNNYDVHAIAAEADAFYEQWIRENGLPDRRVPPPTAHDSAVETETTDLKKVA